MACKYKYKNNWYSEEEVLNLLRKENSSFTTLYNNLIKELETSETGRRVFEQVKRDYKYKDTFIQSNAEISESDNFSNVSYKVWKINKRASFSNTKKREVIVEFDTKKEAEDYVKNLPIEPLTYTLEEQQEEAIVSLISILAAGKLNEKTDRNLISLLKQLLKEMSDFIRHLLRKDVIYINKDLDNISQLTDKELNKLLKDGEVTKKCN